MTKPGWDYSTLTFPKPLPPEYICGEVIERGDPHKNGVLGMEYVDKIEDIGSAQLGIIWEQGKGLLKELPKDLRNGRALR